MIPLKFVMQKSLIFLGIVFSSTAYAWNYQGHVVIAHIAYSILTSAEKKAVDRLTNPIFMHLDTEKQEYLKKRYPNTSNFARLAILPD